MIFWILAFSSQFSMVNAEFKDFDEYQGLDKRLKFAL